MAELLLVSNPGKRKRKGKRGRMPAGLRRYWASRRAGKKHHKKHHRAKARHIRHRRPKGTRRAIGYTVGTRKVRRRKLNPHHRHHYRKHRRYRNPSLRGITGQVMPTVKAGAWGAAGALGLDAAWGLLTSNLPSLAAYLTNPYVTFIAKAFAAVGVGALGGKVARGKGKDLAVGAMTVVTHDFLKSTLQSMAPTLFGPGGTLSLGAYLSATGAPDYMGAYLSGAAPIVGTATIPQAYLPFSGSSGASGSADGVYAEDHMGMDPWG
jgi:hypothetical protein